MALSKRPNRSYPSIPGITEDQRTHTNALQQIRESIETHERRNSNYRKSFIRWEELVDLGIIDDDGNFVLELGTTGGGGTGVTLLGELDDVNVPAPTDNDFLAWDAATQQWTAQTATEAGIATTEEIITLLSELDDINITGGQQYDLLYLALPEWEPSKGRLQFEGTNLHIPFGGIYFRSVGAGGAFVSADISEGGNLDLKSDKDIHLDPLRNVRFDITDGLFDVNQGISYQHADLVPRRHFELTSTEDTDPFYQGVVVQIDFDQTVIGTMSTYNEVIDKSPIAHTVTYATGANVDDGTVVTDITNPRNRFMEGSPSSGEVYVANSVNMDLGTGDFTIEWWQSRNLSNPNINSGIMGWDNGIEIFQLSHSQGGDMKFRYNNVDILIVEVAAYTTGSLFTHVAFVRDNGVLKLFYDGVQRGSVSFTTDVSSGGQQLIIGAIVGLPGYMEMDDVRITKGTARYNSDFSPNEVVQEDYQFTTNTEELTVGDPGFPIELDGSYISIKNQIGVNWDNVAGTPIEHLVFQQEIPGTPLTTSLDNTLGNIVGVRTQSLAGNDYRYYLGDQDFTFETWAYYISDGGDQYLWCQDFSFSGLRVFQFGYDFSAGSFIFVYSLNGIDRFTASWAATPPANQWAFYQLTRSGPDLKFFIDGVQQGTTYNIGTASLFDIVTPEGSTYNFWRFFANDNILQPWMGYAQETRVTIGAARGSTLPTEPFPRGAADPLWPYVRFLCSWDGTPGDDANLADPGDESPVGNIFIGTTTELQDTTLKFFNTTSTPSIFYVGDLGYPTQIDGTGITLNAPVFAKDALIVEGVSTFYLRVDALDDLQVGLDLGVGGNTSLLGTLGVTGAATVTGLLTANADAYVTDELRVYEAGGTDYISDAWASGQIATRSFTNATQYNVTGVPLITLNGPLRVTTTDVQIADGSAIQLFNQFSGTYVDTLTTAIDTGGGGDPDFSSVVFLGLFEGADEQTTYTSDDNGARTATFSGNAKLDSAITPKFNATTALLLDGTGDFISFPDSDDWTFGTGDFTIEGWIYFTSGAGTLNQTPIAQFSAVSNAARGWYVMVAATGQMWFVGHTDASGGNVTLITSTVTGWANSTWYHLAWVRDSANNEMRFYRDGVLEETEVLAGTTDFHNATGTLTVGARDPNAINEVFGLMEGWRITKGVQRYTGSTYTVPTAAFPDFSPPTDVLIGDSVTPGGHTIKFYADEYVFNDAGLRIEEQAAALPDDAGYGQLWVRADTPNTLMFTDDAGTDFVVGGGSFTGISSVVEDDTPQLGGNLDVQTFEINTSTVDGNITLTPNGTGIIDLNGVVLADQVTLGDYGVTDGRLRVEHDADPPSLTTTADDAILIGEFTPTSVATHAVINRTGINFFKGDGAGNRTGTGVFVGIMSYVPSGWNLIFGASSSSGTVSFAGGGEVGVRDAGTFRIYNAADDDYAQFSHDGTDFNTSFTAAVGTTDWNVTGLAGFNVGNYNFDVDQTVGAGQDNYVLTYDNATGLISLEAASGGGIADGTVTSSSVRWSGSAWEEETSFLIDSAGRPIMQESVSAPTTSAGYAALWNRNVGAGRPVWVDDSANEWNMLMAGEKNHGTPYIYAYTGSSTIPGFLSRQSGSGPYFRGFTSGFTTATSGANTVELGPNGNIYMEGALRIEEKAAPASNVAAVGQVWVRNDAPNTLVFRDDVGTDFELAGNLSAPTQLWVTNDAGRPAAGTAGRIFFNTTDGNINIDDGTNWILPDGTTT